MPGIPMGPWPKEIVWTGEFTAAITTEEISGWWWDRLTTVTVRNVFKMDGGWFYEKTGSEVWGWVAIEIKRKSRIRRHERRLETAENNGGRGHGGSLS